LCHPIFCSQILPIEIWEDSHTCIAFSDSEENYQTDGSIPIISASGSSTGRE
jgi:hypothetical protein